MRAATGISALAFGVLLGAIAGGCGGGGESASAVPGGDQRRAPALIDSYGCGSCHTIAGIEDATASVGPPLEDFADRLYIAGELPNTPDNVVRWIMSPQSVEPGTVMPDMGVTPQEARDLAAYLYGH